MDVDVNVNLGLTTPGKCDECSNVGPRFKFYNQFAEPVIEKDLCPVCMRKAIKCVRIFLGTPAGARALRKKMDAAEG